MRGQAALLVSDLPADEFGSEPGSELGGYALVVFRRGSRVARLYSIAVDPSQRRRGLGSRLLRAAESAALAAGADELRLEVRADNRAAIAAYEGAGYQPIGRYSDYYEDHADALRLAKGLRAPAGQAQARPAQSRTWGRKG